MDNADSLNHRNEELYTEYFTPLFKYFFFRLKDYNQAMDLTQTTFLKFLSADYSKNTRIHNTKILFMIARNTLIDYFRTTDKKQNISLENMEIDIKSLDPSPEDDFSSNENILLIKSALEVLNEKEKEIVMLRISTSLDYDDIAEMFKENAINIRQIYSRSLKKLRNYLENKNIYG